MKKIINIFLLALVLTSCHKNDTTPTDYGYFNIDGQRNSIQQVLAMPMYFDEAPTVMFNATLFLKRDLLLGSYENSAILLLSFGPEMPTDTLSPQNLNYILFIEDFSLPNLYRNSSEIIRSALKLRDGGLVVKAKQELGDVVYDVSSFNGILVDTLNKEYSFKLSYHGTIEHLNVSLGNYFSIDSITKGKRDIFFSVSYLDEKSFDNTRRMVIFSEKHPMEAPTDDFLVYLFDDQELKTGDLPITFDPNTNLSNLYYIPNISFENLIKNPSQALKQGFPGLSGTLTIKKDPDLQDYLIISTSDALIQTPSGTSKKTEINFYGTLPILSINQ